MSPRKDDAGRCPLILDQRLIAMLLCRAVGEDGSGLVPRPGAAHIASLQTAESSRWNSKNRFTAERVTRRLEAFGFPWVSLPASMQSGLAVLVRERRRPHRS